MHICDTDTATERVIPIRSVFSQLIGNDRFKTIVGSDLLSGRLGHAYILEGPTGSGKHLAARLTASALSCLNRDSGDFPLPCGSCLVCRKIRENFSPDVITVKREADRATMGVDTVRKIREDLCIAPNENEAKVYIIEDADTMTPQAQNALLLSLEEPPPYVVFFLLTTNASALLETIRSRAPVLRMQQFDSDTLADILAKDPAYEALARSQSDFFHESVLAADGAIGQARQYLSRSFSASDATLTLRADALKIVSAMFTYSASENVSLLLSLPKDRGDAADLLKFVLTGLRDLAVLKKNASIPPLLFPSKEACRAFGEKISVSRIHSAYDCASAAYNDILANASVQTVFTELLMNKH